MLQPASTQEALKLCRKEVRPEGCLELQQLLLWLGRLLGLSRSPTLLECSEGQLVLAALQLLQSSAQDQPHQRSSWSTLTVHVCTFPQQTENSLAGELHAAGITLDQQTLDAVSALDAHATERLLQSVYRFYCLNHAHRFTPLPSTTTSMQSAASGSWPAAAQHADRAVPSTEAHSGRASPALLLDSQGSAQAETENQPSSVSKGVDAAIRIPVDRASLTCSWGAGLSTGKIRPQRLRFSAALPSKLDADMSLQDSTNWPDSPPWEPRDRSMYASSPSFMLESPHHQHQQQSSTPSSPAGLFIDSGKQSMSAMEGSPPGSADEQPRCDDPLTELDSAEKAFVPAPPPANMAAMAPHQHHTHGTNGVNMPHACSSGTDAGLTAAAGTLEGLIMRSRLPQEAHLLDTNISGRCRNHVPHAQVFGLTEPAADGAQALQVEPSAGTARARLPSSSFACQPANAATGSSSANSSSSQALPSLQRSASGRSSLMCSASTGLSAADLPPWTTPVLHRRPSARRVATPLPIPAESPAIIPPAQRAVMRAQHAQRAHHAQCDDAEVRLPVQQRIHSFEGRVHDQQRAIGQQQSACCTTLTHASSMPNLPDSQQVTDAAAIAPATALPDPSLGGTTCQADEQRAGGSPLAASRAHAECCNSTSPDVLHAQQQPSSQDDQLSRLQHFADASAHNGAERRQSAEEPPSIAARPAPDAARTTSTQTKQPQTTEAAPCSLPTDPVQPPAAATVGGNQTVQAPSAVLRRSLLEKPAYAIQQLPPGDSTDALGAHVGGAACSALQQQASGSASSYASKHANTREACPAEAQVAGPAGTCTVALGGRGVLPAMAGVTHGEQDTALPIGEVQEGTATCNPLQTPNGYQDSVLKHVQQQPVATPADSCTLGGTAGGQSYSDSLPHRSRAAANECELAGVPVVEDHATAWSADGSSLAAARLRVELSEASSASSSQKVQDQLLQKFCTAGFASTTPDAASAAMNAHPAVNGSIDSSSAEIRVDNARHAALPTAALAAAVGADPAVLGSINSISADTDVSLAILRNPDLSRIRSMLDSLDRRAGSGAVREAAAAGGAEMQAEFVGDAALDPQDGKAGVQPFQTTASAVPELPATQAGASSDQSTARCYLEDSRQEWEPEAPTAQQSKICGEPGVNMDLSASFKHLQLSGLLQQPAPPVDLPPAPLPLPGSQRSSGLDAPSTAQVRQHLAGAPAEHMLDCPTHSTGRQQQAQAHAADAGHAGPLGELATPHHAVAADSPAHSKSVAGDAGDLSSMPAVAIDVPAGPVTGALAARQAKVQAALDARRQKYLADKELHQAEALATKQKEAALRAQFSKQRAREQGQPGSGTQPAGRELEGCTSTYGTENAASCSRNEEGLSQQPAACGYAGQWTAADQAHRLAVLKRVSRPADDTPPTEERHTHCQAQPSAVQPTPPDAGSRVQMPQGSSTTELAAGYHTDPLSAPTSEIGEAFSVRLNVVAGFDQGSQPIPTQPQRPQLGMPAASPEKPRWGIAPRGTLTPRNGATDSATAGQKPSMHSMPSSVQRSPAKSPSMARLTAHANRKLVRNAICHVCLAGAARQKEAAAVLACLDGCDDSDNFVILFKSSQLPLHYKGLYKRMDDSGEVTKLHGSGPDVIQSLQVATFFKYDSGAREFRTLSTQSFTAITCAVALTR